MEKKVFKLLNSSENHRNLELFVDWCAHLVEHEKEVLETLKEENLVSESITLLQNEEDFYFQCSRTVEAGKDLQPSNQIKPINRVHKKLWQQIKKEKVELPQVKYKKQTLYSFTRY